MNHARVSELRRLVSRSWLAPGLLHPPRGWQPVAGFAEYAWEPHVRGSLATRAPEPYWSTVWACTHVQARAGIRVDGLPHRMPPTRGGDRGGVSGFPSSGSRIAPGSRLPTAPYARPIWRSGVRGGRVGRPPETGQGRRGNLYGLAASTVVDTTTRSRGGW